MQSELAGESKTSGWSVASIVLSSAGFFLPFIGSIAAILTGGIAQAQIASNSPQRTGKGMAWAGIGFGIVGLGIWALAAVLFAGGAIVQEALSVEPVPLSDTTDSESFVDGSSLDRPDLRSGDCIGFGQVDTEVFELSDSDFVDCDSPHFAEFFGAIELDAGMGEIYPGEDAVYLDGYDLCRDLLVGTVSDETDFHRELDVFVVFPLEDGWVNLGDREVWCFGAKADGSALTAPLGESQSVTA